MTDDRRRARYLRAGGTPRGRYHGPAEGGGCEQDRGQLPKAKGAKPEDFADLRFIKELDDSGYIDKLYKK